MQGGGCPHDVLQSSTRLILLSRTLFSRLQTRVHGVFGSAGDTCEQAAVAEDCASEASGSASHMHVDASTDDDVEVVADSAMCTEEKNGRNGSAGSGGEKAPVGFDHGSVQTWLEWHCCMVRVARSVQMVMQSLAEMSGARVCKAGASPRDSTHVTCKVPRALDGVLVSFFRIDLHGRMKLDVSRAHGARSLWCHVTPAACVLFYCVSLTST